MSARETIAFSGAKGYALCVVQLRKVFQVNLQDVTPLTILLPRENLVFCYLTLHQLEETDVEGLAHGPAIEAVCI